MLQLRKERFIQFSNVEESLNQNPVQIIIITSIMEKSSSGKDNNTREGEPNIGEIQFTNLVKPKPF